MRSSVARLEMVLLRCISPVVARLTRPALTPLLCLPAPVLVLEPLQCSRIWVERFAP